MGKISRIIFLISWLLSFNLNAGPTSGLHQIEKLSAISDDYYYVEVTQYIYPGSYYSRSEVTYLEKREASTNSLIQRNRIETIDHSQDIDTGDWKSSVDKNDKFDVAEYLDFETAIKTDVKRSAFLNKKTVHPYYISDNSLYKSSKKDSSIVLSKDSIIKLYSEGTCDGEEELCSSVTELYKDYPDYYTGLLYQNSGQSFITIIAYDAGYLEDEMETPNEDGVYIEKIILLGN